MNADAAMILLDDLFPRAKWSPAMAQQFRDDCAILRLTDEQAEAVIRQHRRERNGSTPQFATLLAGLRKAQFESVRGAEPPTAHPTEYCDQERARRRVVGGETYDGDNDMLLCSYHANVWEHTRYSEASGKLWPGYVNSQRLNLITQLRNDLHKHGGHDIDSATTRALSVWNHWAGRVLGPEPITAEEYADPFGHVAREKDERKSKRKTKGAAA